MVKCRVSGKTFQSLSYAGQTYNAGDEVDLPEEAYQAHKAGLEVTETPATPTDSITNPRRRSRANAE